MSPSSSFLKLFLKFKRNQHPIQPEFKVVMGILQLTTHHKDLFFCALKATIDYGNQ